jgi:bacterioferritin-associated ferredoxin
MRKSIIDQVDPDEQAETVENKSTTTKCGTCRHTEKKFVEAHHFHAAKRVELSLRAYIL